MNNTNEYSLELMSKIESEKLDTLTLYVELENGSKIRYKTLDSNGQEHEGFITKDDTYTELNWHLLDNNRIDTFKGNIISSVIFSTAIDRGHIPMSRNQKLRRAGILCVYFVKNYAYYKAGFDKKVFIDQDEFWITIQNNFLDMAILEWSKLFLKPKSHKYHWENIVRDPASFKKTVLNYDHDRIEIYRDKFVAHLDNKMIMNIPELEGGLDLVCSLYNEIYSQLPSDKKYDMPKNLKEYYHIHLKQAIDNYPRAPN
ncbi:hypothetical protein [Legionella maioricensis]|uniref:HEPN AbiU2-like domain-containing protein n=1 Tax=Legionella maioricensis TaxID=2896528 RepID=A0A9X2D1P9_9GAMM|nr:hypothetical protein [Legionella maioricensis]MCL9684558.1 hypothetical protein [Legionella maioricensis]MCL9687339.1 hypothetical protein [Legionella maioricensis]